MRGPSGSLLILLKRERKNMVYILLLVLECLQKLFFVVVVGGFVSISSAGLMIYILIKLLGVDRIKELIDLEDKIDLLIAKEYDHQTKEDDYVLTKDGEKIPYDEDTQE